jgi:hypothetical protein
MAPSPKNATTMPAPLHLEGVGRADGDRHAVRHYAIGAEHAQREIGDVHRATLAVRGAALAPEQLAHHARRRHALGDRVAVAAVVARHIVGAREMKADARRDRFLPAVLVDRAAHQAGLQRLTRGFLELADKAHGAQHGDDVAGRRRLARGAHGRKLRDLTPGRARITRS